ncbi:MAG TPA: hypothetical protein VLO13_11635, partial [Halomonas sp.]|nr:hypothetical protein [Halomonas sp.]
VRSDILAQLYPADLSASEAAQPAQALAGPWHYRAIEIKFTTLSLLKSGALAADMASYAVQVWLYNEALARLQGFTPSASYILGRAWKRDKERGQRADERLGRVEHDGRIGARGELIADLANEAVGWLRQVATEGEKWQLRPTPSHPKLWPNMKFQEDHPWHDLKKQLANELAELTLLPGMSADKRVLAHAAGFVRWDQRDITAEALGVSGQVRARQLQAVLEANQAVPTNSADAVWPRSIDLADNAWRQPAALELFVDFETVSSLDDDFSKLPESGGKALIFQIGCGHFKEGQWQFKQWTTARLSEDEEMRIITEWLEYLDQMRTDAGLDWSQMRIVHWSSAETSTFLTAYNSAANRHAEHHWPILPWFDFLAQVIRPAPVTVHGAFGFGLKAIAKAMHQHGLLRTQWLDGPADGLGAMVGAWVANAEATQRDVAMEDLSLMQEIAAYNQVDCRAMAEVVIWLRENR